MTLNVFHILAATIAVTGGVVALVLLKVTAPYGRHRRQGWGPTVSSRWGWTLMELPALLSFVVALSQLPTSRAAWMLVALWLWHYGYRSLVFPWRQSRTSRMPLVVGLLGATFNTMNGFLNGWAISNVLDDSRSVSLVALGVSLFAFGFIVHYRSDAHLLALRKRGQGYAIPRDGFFHWVSSPNYLGEIVQWVGFAVAAPSAASAAFAWFTFCNLAPRARSHHRWYHEQFEDYPKSRRALFPRFF